MKGFWQRVCVMVFSVYRVYTCTPGASAASADHNGSVVETPQRWTQVKMSW